MRSSTGPTSCGSSSCQGQGCRLSAWRSGDRTGGAAVRRLSPSRTRTAGTSRTPGSNAVSVVCRRQIPLAGAPQRVNVATALAAIEAAQAAAPSSRTRSRAWSHSRTACRRCTRRARRRVGRRQHLNHARVDDRGAGSFPGQAGDPDRRRPGPRPGLHGSSRRRSPSAVRHDPDHCCPDTGPRLGRPPRPPATPRTACRQRETCGTRPIEAAARAQPGGVVLLSPAAPSYNAYDELRSAR